MTARIELTRAQLEELDQMILQLEKKQVPGDLASAVICVSCVHTVVVMGAWREGIDPQRLAEAKAKLESGGSGPVVSLKELRALRQAAIPTRG